MNYGWKCNLMRTSSFGSLSRDYYYSDMLIDQVLAENMDEVNWLLDVKRADPNTVVPERGVAALHLLAGMENEDFSEEVLLLVLRDHGGDANVRCEEGLTPVHVAVMWGRCRALRVLLQNGGNPDLTDYQLLLDAEEYALRELQWKAYRMLAAYSRHVEGEENSSEGVRSRSFQSEFTSDNKSLVDRMRNPNNQIMCKMSRIFLFMLKRKEVHERLK